MFFQKSKKFDEYVDEAYENKNIVLLDVRSVEEYQSGHLPKSKNVPLDSLQRIQVDKNKELYVFCYSGSRSAMATRQLKQVGYTNVTNIGGIQKCKKPLESRR